MTLIEKAAHFAENAHGSINQKRKYSGLPYFVHCEQVANIVRQAGGTDEMIAAAYLHDTVEDTPVTQEDILREFGPDVASLVEMLTDMSKKEDGNRRTRKQIDLNHTAQASAEGKTIKLADLIANAPDIAKNDPAFGKVFLYEKQALMKVLVGGDAGLYQRAMDILNQCKKDLGLK